MNLSFNVSVVVVKSLVTLRHFSYFIFSILFYHPVCCNCTESLSCICCYFYAPKNNKETEKNRVCSLGFSIHDKCIVQLQSFSVRTLFIFSFHSVPLESSCSRLLSPHGLCDCNLMNCTWWKLLLIVWKLRTSCVWPYCPSLVSD